MNTSSAPHSETVDAAFEHASAVHREGRIRSAIDAYAAVLAIDPDHGRALIQLNRLETALGLPATTATTERGRALQANLAVVSGSPQLTAAEREFFLAYQTNVEALRRSRYMDYPQVVHIETLAVCNAACVFCPYPTMERAGERMSDELFSKILDDLSAIPADLPITVCPFKLSDPLLEKRLFKFLDMIWDRLPQAHVLLATNGSALTDANIERLGNVGRSLDLHISLNDHRREVYEEQMKLPFDRIIERLDALDAAVAAGGFPHAVTVGRVSGDRDADKAFMLWTRDRFPNLAVSVIGAGNWAGDVDSRTHDLVLPIGCVSWHQLSITVRGDIALCCMDGGETPTLGNVAETNALALYNSPAHRRFRESLSRRDIGPCSGCTYPETNSLHDRPAARHAAFS